MATDQQPDSNAGVDGGEGRLPPAVIEELLASSRRRTLLCVLVDRDEPVPVDDLAAHLMDANEPARTERRRVRTEIYQEHLPKLTATGAVGFDSMLGTVEFLGGDALVTRLTALDDDSKDK